MKSFIKKIFEKEIDEQTHSQFVRFGRGKYTKRAVALLYNSAKTKLKGTYEYANDFVVLACELEEEYKVSGIALSKAKISEFMSKNSIKGNCEEKKGGLYFQNNLEEQNIKSSLLKQLVELSYFSLLDLEGKESSLKIKKKLPKPGKSAEAKVDDSFCVLETDAKNFSKIKEAFFWDVPEFKKVKAEHTYEIKDMVLPVGEKDFEKIRIMTKRKGTLTRNLEIDKNTQEKKIDFEA